MKKKKIVALMCAAALVAPVFTACGGGDNAENGELNIYVWTEYIPDSVIDDFEEEYGIKVNVTTFSSNEDMLAKVKAETAGTYDIVQPSDYMVEQMVAQDMLAELDKEKLTNLSNIDDAYLGASYDPENTYSVPYLGGVAAIGVNTSLVDMDITSYDDLFNSALSSSLVVLDDYRAVIGMTERSMGLSMNETEEDVLAEVEEKLLTLKSNVKLYDSDSPKSALISEDCAVAYCWSAEIALAMEENEDIEIVFPTEGAYVFMDNFAITKDSPNYDNAMTFINYMLDSETMQKILEEFPYLCPNKAAIEAMGEEYQANAAKNPPVEVIEAGEYVSNLSTDVIAMYDAMWTRLKQ